MNDVSTKVYCNMCGTPFFSKMQYDHWDGRVCGYVCENALLLAKTRMAEAQLKRTSEVIEKSLSQQ